jgi:hypothetical protein
LILSLKLRNVSSTPSSCSSWFSIPWSRIAESWDELTETLWVEEAKEELGEAALGGGVGRSTLKGSC